LNRRQSDAAVARSLRAACAIESLETRRLLATFIVTSAADAGAGSLRLALQSAGSSSAADMIRFAIPGTGVKTIRPASPLPDLRAGDVLDATTQSGYAGKPLVELYGSRSTAAGSAGNGLVIEPGSTVRGLAIGNFGYSGLLVNSGGATPTTPARIEGNYLGVRADGTTSAGNGSAGITLYSRATIGGRLPAARNVISANQRGIQIGVGTGNDLSNFDGTRIEGNFIGTDAAGVARRGNLNAGIFGQFYGQGAGRLTIGGDVAEAGNLIAFNGSAGVALYAGSQGFVSVRRNRIVGNGGMGLDLAGSGLDLPATATGSLVNRPVITSIVDAGTAWRVGGALLRQPANTTYTLDFYANTNADPTGYGEGELWSTATSVGLGTSGSGTFSVLVPKVSGKRFIAATATSAAGSTSEFSNTTIPSRPFGSLRIETFSDLNGNGLRDGTSEAMFGSNVRTFLDLDRDGTRDVNEPFNYGASAAYMGLAPGTYDLRVESIDPPGQRVSNAGVNGAIVATVADGIESTTLVAIAPAGAGAIRGAVFIDDLADGPTADDVTYQSGVLVYLDANRNEALDAGELVASAIGRGTFEFRNIADGDYLVRIVNPAGYYQTYPAGGRAVQVRAGTVVADVNFGIDRIGGHIDAYAYNDLNRNGQRDGSESLVTTSPGFFEIDLFNDGAGESRPASVPLADGGTRFFAPVGTHAVRFNEYDISLPTFPGRAFLVTIAANNQTARVELPMIVPASLDVHVYQDSNESGTREDGEGGAVGAALWLDLDDDGVQDGNEPSRPTSGGTAVLTGLAPETYRVRVVPPTGMRMTTAAPLLTLASGQHASLLLGVAQTPVTWTVTGTVWDDADADGVRDSGETVLPSRTIYIDRNLNAVLDAGEQTALTDAQGVFRFVDMPARTHPMRCVLFAGERTTTPVSGTHYVGSGTAVPNFGVTRRPPATSSLSGQLFLDVNRNGISDVGDSPLVNRTVFLDADSDGVLDTDEQRVNTDGSGSIYLTRVFEGRYTVRVVLAAGESYTTPLLTVDLSGYLSGVAIGIAR
jgi:hypothetical protein